MPASLVFYMLFTYISKGEKLNYLFHNCLMWKWRQSSSTGVESTGTSNKFNTRVSFSADYDRRQQSSSAQYLVAHNVELWWSIRDLDFFCIFCNWSLTIHWRPSLPTVRLQLRQSHFCVPSPVNQQPCESHLNGHKWALGVLSHDCSKRTKYTPLENLILHSCSRDWPALNRNRRAKCLLLQYSSLFRTGGSCWSPLTPAALKAERLNGHPGETSSASVWLPHNSWGLFK